jgi:Domain of unknown function (DUF4304)
MNSPAPRLESAIKDHLASLLRADGFGGSGRTCRRVQDGWLQVVNVQGSKYGGSFAVNLGLQPLAIPDVMGSPTDPKKTTEVLCEFRRRLSETEERSDKWWHHDNTVEGIAEAVQSAAETYVLFARPVLNRVTSDTSDLNVIRAVDLRSRSFNFGGFGSTEVRMSLALARLRASRGRIREAREFVQYGLTILGTATSLRSQFLAVVPSDDA